MLEGLAINEAAGKVVFLAKLNGTQGSPVNKPYLVSVPIGGGDLGIEYEIKSDISGGLGTRFVFQLYSYMKKSNIPIIANSETSSAPTVGPYFSNNGTFNPVWSVLSVYLGLAYDEDSNSLYSCDFDVRKYSPIPMTKEGRVNNETMYQNQMCTGILKQGNSIYLSANGNPGTRFLRGSTECRGCAASELVEIFKDSNESARSIANHNDAHLYYSTANGLFQFTIPQGNGTGTDRKQLVSGDIRSIAYYNGFVYFQDALNAVKKVDVTSGQVTTLFNAQRTFPGQCSCATGFSGSDCGTCNGIIRWNNGPQCVALLPDGNPAVCFNDWECHNNPYSYCFYSKCKCRPNFTGPNCNECSGRVEWSGGSPVCILNN
eukprot:gene6010-7487_t